MSLLLLVVEVQEVLKVEVMVQEVVVQEVT